MACISRMINPSDLIPLPFTPDLAQAAIRYTCRMLSRSANPEIAAREPQMRQSVAQAIVELALLRHLTGQAVPFTILADAPFTDPQHTGLVLGGHRCQVYTHLLARKTATAHESCFSQDFLEKRRLDFTAGPLPDAWETDDLIIAGVLSARVLLSVADSRAAWRSLDPLHMVVPQALEWVSPHRWVDPGPLTLRSGCSVPIEVELEGLDGQRHPLSETITLAPGETKETEERYYALAAVQVFQAPDGPLALHYPNRNLGCTIQPRQWTNLWPYGAQIALLGYQRRADTRRGAPYSDLQPLGNLFNRLKEWSQR
jgi:hypothetical protein